MGRLAVAVAALALATPSGTARWFHSPTGNIQCELSADAVRGTYAYCQTFVPPQSVTLHRSGRLETCAHGCAVGNGPENARVLPSGRSLRVGPFRCSSTRRFVRCVALPSGGWFTIAREGLRTSR
jgi:hypothetical protein